MLKLRDGEYVPVRDLPRVVQKIREATGMSPQEVAEYLNVPEQAVVQAEGLPHRDRFKLRKRLMEHFAGLTLEGPYYRIVRTGE